MCGQRYAYACVALESEECLRKPARSFLKSTGMQTLSYVRLRKSLGEGADRRLCGCERAPESVMAVSGPPAFWKKTGASIWTLGESSLAMMSLRSPCRTFWKAFACAHGHSISLSGAGLGPSVTTCCSASCKLLEVFSSSLLLMNNSLECQLRNAALWCPQGCLLQIPCEDV